MNPYLVRSAVQPASTSGRDDWQELGSGAVSLRRRRPAWFEQQELWPANAAAVRADQFGEGRVFEEEPARGVFVREEVDIEEVPHMDAFDVHGTGESYRRRERGVRLDVIAKFLQVNRAVDGVDGSSRFALPRRGFAAKCSLWKGSPVGTPFLTGC